MTGDIGQIVLTSAIPGLALASLFLSRRSPSYRPLSASLLLLAAIDLARLVAAPHAALKEWGWWQADVCLCALWPVAIGVGLAQKRRPGGDQPVEPYSVTREPRLALASRITHRATREASTIARLASLCSLAFLLGALRPWLPRVVYLTGLRLPRWALAELWVEVLAGAWMARQSKGPDVSADPSPTREPAGFAGRSRLDALQGQSITSVAAWERRGDRWQDNQSGAAAQALACSLILAACNTADLIAGAWLVTPWQPPAWQYARACTWAAYAGVGVVMGWAAWRERRA